MFRKFENRDFHVLKTTHQKVVIYSLSELNLYFARWSEDEQFRIISAKTFIRCD